MINGSIISYDEFCFLNSILCSSKDCMIDYTKTTLINYGLLVVFVFDINKQDNAIGVFQLKFIQTLWKTLLTGIYPIRTS